MLRIRLARRGKKRQPSYRIVVAESSSPRDGRYVEQIGHFNPMVNPEVFKLNEDRALHWLNVGAQPSDAVRRLLEKQGTIARLARVQAGESIEAVAADFTGVEAPVVEAVAEVVEAVVEEPAEVVEEVAEAVEEVAEVAEEAAEEVEAVAEEAPAEESADDEAAA